MPEHQKVETETERVRVFLRGGIIAQGDAHLHKGTYQTRVSDLLNRKSEGFLPLTDVTYQAPGAPPERTRAFAVHLADIVAVDLTVGSWGDEADAADAAEAVVEPPPPPDATA